MDLSLEAIRLNGDRFVEHKPGVPKYAESMAPGYEYWMCGTPAKVREVVQDSTISDPLPLDDRLVRVLVTGGRDYNSALVVRRALNVIQRHNRGIILAQGGALGADALASYWAKTNGHCAMTWPYIERMGRAGGIHRNRMMFNEFQPDIVVAFPGGTGTRNMVDYAYKQDHSCILEVQDDGSIQINIRQGGS